MQAHKEDYPKALLYGWQYKITIVISVKLFRTQYSLNTAVLSIFTRLTHKSEESYIIVVMVPVHTHVQVHL